MMTRKLLWLLIMLSLALPLVGCQPKGEELYRDDFSNPDTGWEETDSANITRGYKEGSYQFEIRTAQTDDWVLANQDFKNVSVEADLTRTRGLDDNNYGVVCKYSSPISFYAFVISSDGSYMIEKRTKQGFARLSGTQFEISDRIKTGGKLNHIKAVCGDGFLELYVNGKFVDRAEDDALTSGDVGLFAGTYADSLLKVSFDNFVVRSIP